MIGESVAFCASANRDATRGLRSTSGSGKNVRDGEPEGGGDMDLARARSEATSEVSGEGARRVEDGGRGDGLFALKEERPTPVEEEDRLVMTGRLSLPWNWTHEPRKRPTTPSQ